MSDRAIEMAQRYTRDAAGRLFKAVLDRAMSRAGR